MPSDVHSASASPYQAVAEVSPWRVPADDGDAELSLGTAAIRFVALLVATLASAVAISGVEPMQFATVVGLL